MGSNLYPIPVTTQYSTIPPVNASNVLSDGELVNSYGHSITISGNNGLTYFYAGGNPTVFTINSGISYYVASGVTLPINVPSGVVSITISGGPSNIPAPVINSVLTITFSGTTSLTNQNWNASAFGVVSGTNTFVALATSTTSGMYSTNGTTWNQMAAPSLKYTSAVFGGGTFVAIATATASGCYSTDGIHWTTMTLPAVSTWCSIAYGVVSGTGTFVAIDTTTSGCYSTNGHTWTLTTRSGSGSLTTNGSNVVFGNYGGGSYFQVFYNGSLYQYSTNGQTWNPYLLYSSDGSGAMIAAVGVISGNSTAAVATPINANGGFNTVVSSGINSTGLGSYTAAPISGINSMAYIPGNPNGYFIVVGSGVSITNPFFASNYQGATWDWNTPSLNVFTTTLSGFNTVCYGNYTTILLGSGTTENFITTFPQLPIPYGIYSGPTTYY
jgi:hypothetical protein